MNIIKSLLVFCLLTITFYASSYAQIQHDSIPLTTIIARTSALTNDHPTEKVYIHFDKPYYAVGDTIWLKAYITMDLHVPTSISKIVYVDIANNENILIDRLKLPVTNGVAMGFLPLPSIYFKLGNYHIRGYTTWMRNADPAYFFNKNLAIGSFANDQVITHISFKNTINDKLSKVNAAIVYKDQDDKPYANKKVSWEALNDDESLSKGKGETDKDGILHVNFTTNKLTTMSTAVITTQIDIADKKLVNQTFGIETSPAGVDFQLFPEGGALINGVRSRIAFKAIKPDGLGIDVKGTIVDNNGTVVADFTSQHLGMGVFAILPEANKTYKANVIFQNGSQAAFDLPTARIDGINLSLNNADPDNLGLKIAANDLYFQKNQNKTYYVIGQSGGVVCYAAQTVLKNQVYSANIPKSKFPTGIVQLTLFSAIGSPLSERIAFIQHNDQLNLSIKSDLASYSKRQKVKMLVSAKNKTLPSEGNFSVAIINEATVPFDENAETTILTHLLLTSDLKGYIEKPNYYFLHPDDITAGNMDVLMLTQGYRRFLYKNIIAGKYPPVTFLPEKGIEISGTLRSATGLPIAKGSMRLIIPDKNFSTQTITDMSGNFKFSNVIISDSSRVILNSRDNPNSSGMVINVDGMLAPPPLQLISNVTEIANIDSALRPYLLVSKKELSNPRNLKEVQIKAVIKVKKPSHSDYSTLMGLSMEPDHTIPGDRFNGCPVFISCLNTVSMGLTYEDNNLFLTRDYNAGKKTPVAIYVDGKSVDYNYLSSINSQNVESAEIFYSDGFAGINKTSGTKGVLEINLKAKPKGEKITLDQLHDLMPKTNVIEFVPGGYSASRQFYSPRYDTAAGSSVGIDLRTTIYWNPVIMTDKSGNATFEFFNNDNRGIYRAVIEGVDKDGNIGRYVYRYKVE